MENRSYQVKVRYIFEGDYTMKAATREEAAEFVQKHCGLVMGGSIHTSLNCDTVDWNFPIHPELIISSVRIAKRSTKRKHRENYTNLVHNMR